MSNENPNNSSHWRSKLDELEHLPTSAFSSDAAWNKLYGRLRGNRKSTRTFWYWIAAACLMFGLVITLLNSRKSPVPALNKETAVKQLRQVKKSTPQVDDTNKNENTAEVIKGKIVPASNRPVQRNRHIVPTGVVTKVESNVVMNDLQQELTAKPLQIVNNPAIVAVPPKKKLNVVHINELGDPVIGTPDMAHNTSIHSFQLKFASGEVLANPAVISGANSFTSLRTKPPSN